MCTLCCMCGVYTGCSGCVDTHVWRAEGNFRPFSFIAPYLYFLRQAFSLNLKLTDPAKLQGFVCLLSLPSQDVIIGIAWLFFLSSAHLNSGLQACIAATLLTRISGLWQSHNPRTVFNSLVSKGQQWATASQLQRECGNDGCTPTHLVLLLLSVL